MILIMGGPVLSDLLRRHPLKPEIFFVRFQFLFLLRIAFQNHQKTGSERGPMDLLSPVVVVREAASDLFRDAKIVQSALFGDLAQNPALQILTLIHATRKKAHHPVRMRCNRVFLYLRVENNAASSIAAFLFWIAYADLLRDNFPDWQLKFLCKLKISFVVRGNRHNGARAVGAEHIIRSPYRNLFAIRGIYGFYAEELYAGFFATFRVPFFVIFAFCIGNILFDRSPVCDFRF